MSADDGNVAILRLGVIFGRVLLHMEAQRRVLGIRGAARVFSDMCRLNVMLLYIEDGGHGGRELRDCAGGGIA